MRARRIAWRMVVRSLVSLIGAWFVFHKLEESTDVNLPFSLQEPIERGIGFLLLCVAILLLVELAFRLVARFQQ